jgi:hypothetical protein
VHAKFGEGFFFLRLTRISRGKAGKYARGINVEKSKKNCRRIVEIFGECRPRVAKRKTLKKKRRYYGRVFMLRRVGCMQRDQV